MIKEMIAEIINGFDKGKYCLSEAAQAILDLCFPCKECGGKKHLPYSSRNSRVMGIPSYKVICPTCKGTGKGEKMLAVLDSDQSLPKPIDDYLVDMTKEQIYQFKCGWNYGQQTMISEGWKKEIRE